MFRDVRLRKTVQFLRAIQIPVIAREIDTQTVFPGHLISHGTLIVDENKLVAIGDTLHEAAHIALAPPERRSSDVAFLSADGGEELTTIAWCYAASIAIGLELEDVSIRPHIRAATRRPSSPP